MTRANGEHDWSLKTVFSTGEAAQVCNVSQQTIIRCFDSGKLQGFRVPGSKFRRIPRDELIRFMRTNGIPVSAIEGSVRRVLCVFGAGSRVSALASALGEMDRVDLVTVTSGFDAGWALAQHRPHLVVLESGSGVCTAEMIRSRIDEVGGAVRPRIGVVADSAGGQAGVTADPESDEWSVRVADRAEGVAAELLGALEDASRDG